MPILFPADISFVIAMASQGESSSMVVDVDMSATRGVLGEEGFATFFDGLGSIGTKLPDFAFTSSIFPSPY